MSDKCRDCGRACKATRAEAMELTSGASGRFADGISKANGELLAEACHCEQMSTLYRRLWDNDDCTDADVAIGLAVALPTFRDSVIPQVSSESDDAELPILVVPLPGEAHLLSAVLAARALESDEHRVDFRVPASLDEMCQLVQRRRYAGVVVVTSTVFSRSSRRRFIEACGDALHNASEAPLRVVLYGRMAEDLGGEPVAGIDATTSGTDDLLTKFEPKVLRIH